MHLLRVVKCGLKLYPDRWAVTGQLPSVQIGNSPIFSHVGLGGRSTSDACSAPEMQLTTHTTPSGFRLPSIHAAHAFFTEQPNPTTQSVFADNWIRLILSYARHRRLFILRVEDAEVAGGDWDEILRNERINRRVLPSHLNSLISAMVSRNLAYYEPPKQTRSVILLWRLPEEWADVLHSWGTATGQLNTILTLYEITDPPVPSPLSGMPLSLLRRAIAILTRSGRAQLIGVADGEGVRLLAGGK
ncbi:ESCRT-II complex subunit-domain-containing protein [Pisolithus croceorrhizus]|nr:ESCRT-II complex subunit-domain-containing protein [Pisolithus croceorrhizus]